MSFEHASDIQREIDSLLHPTEHLSFINRGELCLLHQFHDTEALLEGEVDEKFEFAGGDNVNENAKRTRVDLADRNGFISKGCGDYISNEVFEQIDEARSKAVVIRGKDIGDLPTQYVVTDLRHNEAPVIGTYVDKRIVLGFKYRVRMLTRNNRYLFQGKAMTLQRVGMGYAKRITFEGESKNYNPNYFYSDTLEHGYGFNLVALEEGDAFVVCDQKGFAVGEGTIHQVSIQKELSTTVEANGAVMKQVAVAFTCAVQYGGAKHGLMPLFAREILQLSGVAIVEKVKGAPKAVTQAVEQVELPCFGPCVLNFSY